MDSLICSLSPSLLPDARQTNVRRFISLNFISQCLSRHLFLFQTFHQISRNCIFSGNVNDGLSIGGSKTETDSRKCHTSQYDLISTRRNLYSKRMLKWKQFICIYFIFAQIYCTFPGFYVKNTMPYC